VHGVAKIDHPLVPDDPVRIGLSSIRPATRVALQMIREAVETVGRPDAQHRVKS
jgi:hypothetical protein